jgi:hypothetical protein
MGVVTVHRPFIRYKILTYFPIVVKAYTVRGKSFLDLEEGGYW